MNDAVCRYPRGGVKWDTDSILARQVKIIIDPEDAIDILKELQAKVCPEALQAVGDALHARGHTR